MNKTVLTTLGLAGACVACCTIPLAIPLLGGAAALGLTSWVGTNLRISLEVLVFAVIAATAAVAWGATTWVRRRRAQACANEPASTNVCAVRPAAQGCGCTAR